MGGRSRRRFLQTSLAGLTALLAGCGLPGGEGEGEEGGEEGGEGGESGETGEGGEGGESGEGGGDDDRSAPAFGPDG